MKSFPLTSIIVLSAGALAAPTHDSASGMVVKINPPTSTIIVSCDPISGKTTERVRAFSVRDRNRLQSLRPGDTAQFTITTEDRNTYADDLTVKKFETVETDPLQARRLKLLARGPNNPASPTIEYGAPVPNFHLVDQQNHPVQLADFRGKVIAVNFMYTRCPLQNFCYRLSNNLGQLQQRFRQILGQDLVLLTITFDPVHDRPAELTQYAKTWKADPRYWHFLTGSEDDIKRLCDMFGVDHYSDEGLFAHSLHTLVIDRNGTLVANLEGNRFSAAQLGDLVQATLDEHR